MVQSTRSDRRRECTAPPKKNVQRKRGLQIWAWQQSARHLGVMAQPSTEVGIDCLTGNGEKKTFSKISKCLIACFSSAERYTQHKSHGSWPSIFSVSGVPEIVSCSSSPSCRASCEVPPAAPSVLIFKAFPGVEPTPADTPCPICTSLPDLSASSYALAALSAAACAGTQKRARLFPFPF